MDLALLNHPNLLRYFGLRHVGYRLNAGLGTLGLGFYYDDGEIYQAVVSSETLANLPPGDYGWRLLFTTILPHRNLATLEPTDPLVEEYRSFLDP